ncbi:MAG TPA: archaellin/type IV pilin N-terminal domain-containing protein [Thermoplasmata archaeon]|nr:archaellin/type IV pilin N-terminal domain-containing protein [Thermoplasmata archaeon]
MNVFGHSERSWRKARKRGVSPIIATILLVAITVVLAAVLYVLISGLTKGPGTSPLGTDFGWGQPNNATGTTPVGCAATTLYCYSVEIVGIGGGITMSSLTLSLRNALGSTVAWPGATAPTISLISPTTAAAVATYATGTSSWTPVGSFNGLLASGMTVVVYLSTGPATGTHIGLLGDSIVAIGGSGWSGTVISSAFS